MAYDRKDAFHQRAKREGFRSRAAYKLDEIQRAQRLLRPGQRVADLGCWPGGWLQVAAAAIGPEGRVVGVDQAPIDPPLDLANVVAFEGDLCDPTISKQILEHLGGPAQVLLSDAAPKLTGIKAADRARAEGLLDAIEARIEELLAPGGSLLLKILDAPEADAAVRRIGARFVSARTLRPKATRKGSRERYLLARDFRGAGA